MPGNEAEAAAMLEAYLTRHVPPGEVQGKSHPENPDNRGRARTTESNAETSKEQAFRLEEEVGPAGFEPATQSFEGSCSVP